MEIPKDASAKAIILTRQPPIAIIQLNRPESLNALNCELMSELVSCLENLDTDADINAVVITGGRDAFAAGADIEEMAAASTIEMIGSENLRVWDRIGRTKKPTIAAVNGFAPGGGCELAMLCDIIVAGENAEFGQPEINPGLMPGAGDTQRLPRTVRKHRAMKIVLTGKMFGAEEAMRWGLVNKVVPAELCIEEAVRLANLIASNPPVAVRLAKGAVRKSLDFPLGEGLAFERKNLYPLFPTYDQTEGMNAFIERRKAVWKGR